MHHLPNSDWPRKALDRDVAFEHLAQNFHNQKRALLIELPRLLQRLPERELLNPHWRFGSAKSEMIRLSAVARITQLRLYDQGELFAVSQDVERRGLAFP